jgi:hypothetical protein
MKWKSPPAASGWSVQIAHRLEIAASRYKPRWQTPPPSAKLPVFQSETFFAP